MQVYKTFLSTLQVLSASISCWRPCLRSHSHECGIMLLRSLTLPLLHPARSSVPIISFFCFRDGNKRARPPPPRPQIMHWFPPGRLVISSSVHLRLETVTTTNERTVRSFVRLVLFIYSSAWHRPGIDLELDQLSSSSAFGWSWKHHRRHYYLDHTYSSTTYSTYSWKSDGGAPGCDVKLWHFSLHLCQCSIVFPQEEGE